MLKTLAFHTDFPCRVLVLIPQAQLGVLMVTTVSGSNSLTVLEGEGAVAQSIERATPGEEVLGSIPAVAARSLLVGSETEVMVSPLCLVCGST